jgi:hypothetical protein
METITSLWVWMMAQCMPMTTASRRLKVAKVLRGLFTPESNKLLKLMDAMDNSLAQPSSTRTVLSLLRETLLKPILSSQLLKMATLSFGR